jgi:4-coumarate--CoA ligase
MTVFSIPQPPLSIPDDLTLPQFMLDHTHPNRPTRPSGTPWFIQEETGRQVHLEEVRSRVAGVANALALDYGLSESTSS